ncbi:serine protease, S1-C subfamily, contains C-terminal PDZ domain [Duganella sp. CF402]|uniref:S1 family peptidase n=1 Tax=unclassified Duganella TaxID=2636909 RepID=UPI0008CA756C|nr:MULTISPECIES: serine protease [unclassified Duganella]RZT09514.1 S1-C subfamily serine protease [Duganella sp. BK701]SEL54438.1 serine protease, S1-C subfamily, contains C-terminal PDZ domain [Duganella sp. CF402]
MKVIKLAALLALTWGCAGIAPAAPETSAAAQPAQPAARGGAPAAGHGAKTPAAPAAPVTTATTPAGAPAATADANPDSAPLPPPSSAAQHLYASAKNDILQVRSLLKSGRTQSSVGSGFLIGTSNLVLTNYHVVSQFALDPDTYVGEWVDTGGQRGNVELLAVDVLHDLAVLRVNRSGTGFFKMPEQLARLTQGQYLYSMGNPLDLGFAISEGAYNGVIARSFYDQLMFTGPINSGMSGGPSVTVDGSVAGVNVSKRLDGELVSFLVPARYAQDLLKKVEAQQKAPTDFTAVVAGQLLTHQTAMVNQLLSSPLSLKPMGPYQVPVRESEQMRCWGRSNVKADKPFTVDDASCAMESAIFVSGSLQTGQISIRHQFLRSTNLDKLRFAQLASASFKNEHFGSNKDARLTGPNCTEDFVKNKDLPLRAVLCVRAYRKFAGLYDFALLTASTDQGLMSLQSRIDARGVSYENGLRLTRVFLESLSLNQKPKKGGAK